MLQFFRSIFTFFALVVMSLAGSYATTFTVNNSGDVDDGNPGNGVWSLREAIIQANLSAGPHTINFNLASPYTINITSQLPYINQQVTIDGSQATGTPKVIIDGTNAPGSSALIFNYTNCIVKYLIITNINNNAISVYSTNCQILNNIVNKSGVALNISSANGTIIKGNILGTDAISSTGLANVSYDIYVDDSDNTIIGGNGEGNVLAGVTLVASLMIGNGSDNTTVSGNYIGNNGTSAFSSTNNTGIYVNAGVSGTIIGGNATIDRNVISGSSFGVFSYSGLTLKNNLIGTNVSGTDLISGSTNYFGVYFTTVTGIASTIEGNLISGFNIGINLSSSSDITIKGNKIGTNLLGLQAIPNFIGISLDNTGSVTIGGSNPVDGNIISGNSGSGIEINNGSNNINIFGNRIGVNNNNEALGNLGNGILIGGTSNNIIGGSGGYANIIANNSTNGINIQTGSYNKVLKNSIYNNSNLAINLNLGQSNQGNYGKGAPTITSITYSAPNYIISGTTTDANDNIELFSSDGLGRSAYSFLGEVTAVGGNWTITVSNPPSTYFVATATTTSGNTSQLSTMVAYNCTAEPIILINTLAPGNFASLSSLTSTDLFKWQIMGVPALNPPTTLSNYTVLLQVAPQILDATTGALIPDWANKVEYSVTTSTLNVGIQQKLIDDLIDQVSTDKNYFWRVGLKYLPVDGYGNQPVSWSDTWAFVLKGADLVIPAASYLAAGNPTATTHTNNINWVYEVTYLDDNKTNQSITYLDGLGLGRQSQALMNTSNKIICAETAYSEEGGGSVQSMAAPINTSQFGYAYRYFDVNVAGTYYDFATEHFDREVKGSTYNDVMPPFAVDNTAGVGYYYSANNTMESYVDDAQGFPYAYSVGYKEPSNRLMLSGGVGSTFKITGGREIKSASSGVSFEELARVYGKTQAGTMTNISKDIVTDANGVSTVSYSDMEGKVIATALQGCSAPNLDALTEDGMTGFTNTYNVLQNDKLNKDNLEKISNSNFYVPCGGTTVTLHYEIDLGTYTIETGNCQNCLYDLTIKVIEDATKAEVYNNTQQMPASPSTPSCSTSTSHYTFDTPVSITRAGTYTVYRILKPHVDAVTGKTSVQTAIDTYVSTLTSSNSTLRDQYKDELYTQDEYYMVRKLKASTTREPQPRLCLSRFAGAYSNSSIVVNTYRDSSRLGTYVKAMDVDDIGNIYFIHSDRYICKIDAVSGKVTQLFDFGIANLIDLTTDEVGNIYFTESASNGVIRKLSTTGSITIVYTPKTNKRQIEYYNGYLYFTYSSATSPSTLSNVAKIGVDGTVIVDAYLPNGSELPYFIQNNTSRSMVVRVASDGTEEIYFTCSVNNVIYKVKNGSFSVLAGLSGTSGYANGTPANARFRGPRGITSDKIGNLYVIDQYTIRKLDAGTFMVSKIAGTDGTAGFTDGATDAVNTSFQFSAANAPTDICYDKNGNIYIGDQNSMRLLASCGTLPTCPEILSTTQVSYNQGVPQKVVLQPGSEGKDAYIWSRPDMLDWNGGYVGATAGTAWTWSGTPGVIRTLFDFDRSKIPAGSYIVDARLSLYSKSGLSDATAGHSSLSGSNASYIERITQNWGENTVTWNNQPTTTTTNRVSLAQSTSQYQSYENIDVTALVRDMMTSPSSSFGFMLKLQTEAYYRQLLFGSSDHPDPSIHPKIEITYVPAPPAASCGTLSSLTNYATVTMSVVPGAATSGTAINIGQAVWQKGMTPEAFASAMVTSINTNSLGTNVGFTASNNQNGNYFNKTVNAVKVAAPTGTGSTYNGWQLKHTIIYDATLDVNCFRIDVGTPTNTNTNILTNGEFTSNTGWYNDAAGTTSATFANPWFEANALGPVTIYSGPIMTVGKRYRLSFNQIGASSSSILTFNQIKVGTSTPIVIGTNTGSTPGIFNWEFVSTGEILSIYANMAGVDNIILKEVEQKELVTNGNFSTTTGGWYTDANRTTLAVVNGGYYTSSSGDIYTNPILTIGKRYRLKFDHLGASAAGGINMKVLKIALMSSTTVFSISGNKPGQYVVDFIADGEVLDINLGLASVDNISITEIDQQMFTGGFNANSCTEYLPYLDKVTINNLTGGGLEFVDLDGKTNGSIGDERYVVTSISSLGGITSTKKAEFLDAYERMHWVRIKESDIKSMDSYSITTLSTLPSLNEDLSLNTSDPQNAYLIKIKFTGPSCEDKCKAKDFPVNCEDNCTQQLKSLDAELKSAYDALSTTPNLYNVTGFSFMPFCTLKQLVDRWYPFTINMIKEVDDTDNLSQNANNPKGLDLYMAYESARSAREKFNMDDCRRGCNGAANNNDKCASVQESYRSCVYESIQSLTSGKDFLMGKWTGSFPYTTTDDLEKDRISLGELLYKFILPEVQTPGTNPSIRTSSNWEVTVSQNGHSCSNCGAPANATYGCSAGTSWDVSNFPDLLLNTLTSANAACSTAYLANLDMTFNPALGICKQNNVNCISALANMTVGSPEYNAALAECNTNYNCSAATSLNGTDDPQRYALIRGTLGRLYSSQATIDNKTLELYNQTKSMSLGDLVNFLFNYESEDACRIQCSNAFDAGFQAWLDVKKLTAVDNITTQFQNTCYNRNEKMTVSYTTSIYHYTLFNYNSANDLISTVPPEGIDYIDIFNSDPSKANRVPSHRMITTYTSNSVGQLTNAFSPDANNTKYLYDKAGRIRYSQTDEQAARGTAQSKVIFSYTKYENETGRILEVGEYAYAADALGKGFINPSPGGPDIYASDKVDDFSWPTDGNRTFEESYFYYDNVTMPMISGYTQDNVYNRVSMISNAHSNTYYSYDKHGRVKFSVQELLDMQVVAQRLKVTEYEYKPLTSQITKVIYQKGNAAEEMDHRFTYDLDNRVTLVEISRDGTNWSRATNYEYYLHGALKAEGLGDDIQHVNYVYNLQGWLKAINNPLQSYDPGQDGISGPYAKDVFGEVLNYYSGDYKLTGKGLDASASLTPQTGTLVKDKGKDLFNGNISSIVSYTGFDQVSGNTVNPLLAQGFRYDILNRLVGNFAETKVTTGFSGWTANTVTMDNIYQENLTYDANGNIKTLARTAHMRVVNGTGGAVTALDNMSYKYDQSITDFYGITKKANNKLNYIADTDVDDALIDDIKNQSSTNYAYDAKGRMTQDLMNEIQTITYYPNDKVKDIIRTAGSTKPSLTYTYDAMGIKISKTVTKSATDQTQNYVVYYAGGGQAIYEKRFIDQTNYKYVLVEQATSGGTYKNGNEVYNGGTISTTLTKSQLYFEINDHLGNVRAVVTGQKTGVSATIVNLSDYYPFGMEISDRQYTSQSYRYGFNGMEKDNEWNGVNGSDGNTYGTEFRQYDPRVGRWMSPDPLASIFADQSPYDFVFNCPLVLVDPLGLAPTNVPGGNKSTTKSKHGTAGNPGKKPRTLGTGKFIDIVVQAGETLWELSNEFEVSIEEIRAANEALFKNRKNKNLIKTGETLKIPNKYYKEVKSERYVQKGDVLKNDKFVEDPISKLARLDDEYKLRQRREISLLSTQGGTVPLRGVMQLTADYGPLLIETYVMFVVPELLTMDLESAYLYYKLADKVEYSFTKTAGGHLLDIVKRGENAGQLSRPYMKSPLTIEEIMSAGGGVPDATFPGGMNYKVPGTFRGSEGVWELGINPVTNVIYHFNFVH